ncbi:hypothetical protein D3C87_1737410 [compost metagenome]
MNLCVISRFGVITLLAPIGKARSGKKMSIAFKVVKLEIIFLIVVSGVEKLSGECIIRIDRLLDC